MSAKELQEMEKTMDKISAVNALAVLSTIPMVVMAHPDNDSGQVNIRSWWSYPQNYNHLRLMTPQNSLPPVKGKLLLT